MMVVNFFIIELRVKCKGRDIIRNLLTENEHLSMIDLSLLWQEDIDRPKRNRPLNTYKYLLSKNDGGAIEIEAEKDDVVSDSAMVHHGGVIPEDESLMIISATQGTLLSHKGGGASKGEKRKAPKVSTSNIVIKVSPFFSI
jgi:hypothetical protein